MLKRQQSHLQAGIGYVWKSLFSPTCQNAGCPLEEESCVCASGSSQSHQRTDEERLTVVHLPGTAMAGPDPALSIDGSKLAMNPSVHSAIPKACQLGETKPFVGPLNPTDGEMDSKRK